MTSLATSKNLTILGILAIVGAVVAAATQWAEGGFASIKWEAFFAAVVAGVMGILAKGQQNTGGTIASTPEAVKRVGEG